MKHNPLIVFEGVDNSGKTTISKIIAKRYPEFKWSKEPLFSTEEADRLNSDEFKGKDAKREVFFLEGRLRQQKFYNGNMVLLDRYLWSGLAYAKAFSPSIYSFCEELYQDFNIFKQPDLYIFMDTPLETCYDREPKLKETPGRLETLRTAYAETEKFLGNTPVVYVDGRKGIEECVGDCIDAIAKQLPELNMYDNRFGRWLSRVINDA
jgi:thymidylate kinase